MANRLHLFALLILACISALNGEYISSVGELSAAYAIQCHDQRFFLLASLSNVHRMRVLGVIGYLFCALGRFDIGDVFLSLHYGVVGIDDAELSALGKISSGAASLSLVL
jgi:hypothetical protein